MEELAAVDESQNKVQLLRRLEGEFERDNEGIVNLSKHRPFGEGMRHLRTRNDVRFAKSFQCIDSMGISFPVSLHVRNLSRPRHTKKTAN